jgi:serine/threonine-protein kinase
VLVAGLTGVTQLVAGGATTCALKAGQAICWGANDWAQLGRGENTQSMSEWPAPVEVNTGTPLDNIVEIDLGGSYGCATTEDRSVYCWGTSHRRGHGSEESTLRRARPVKF